MKPLRPLVLALSSLAACGGAPATPAPAPAPLPPPVTAAPAKEATATAEKPAPPKTDPPPVAELKGAAVRGDRVVVPGDVHFDTAVATFDDQEPETKKLLEFVLSVMRDNPKVTRLRVEGHTDSDGNRADNQILSAKRAHAVADWLVVHGVAPQRLSIAGFGQDVPVAPNDTPENKAKNRRTEFHVEELEGRVVSPPPPFATRPTGAEAPPSGNAVAVVDFSFGRGCIVRKDHTAACDDGTGWRFPDAVSIRSSEGACVVDHGGKLWCIGPVGLPSPNAAPKTPIVVAGEKSPVVDYAVSMSRGCAVTKNGTLSCWGENMQFDENGQSTSYAAPFPVLKNVAQVAVGPNETCALLRDGTVKCWGLGFEGALGDPSCPHDKMCSRPTPVAIPVKNVVQIAGGSTYCVRHRNGTISCWGANRSGQAGNGTTKAVYEPALVAGIENAVDVGVGEIGCAALKDGSVSCWGKSRGGALGDGKKEDRLTPGPVPNVKGAVRLRIDETATCAADKAGDFTCWGRYARLSRGNASKDGTAVPMHFADVVPAPAEVAGH